MGPYTFNFSWLRKEKPNHSILFLEKSYLVVFLHKLMEHWSLNISESVNLRNLFLFLWLRSKDDLRHFGRNNLKQKSYKYRTENFYLQPLRITRCCDAPITLEFFGVYILHTNTFCITTTQSSKSVD